MHIRPFKASDTAAIYDICVRTADAGGDARGQYHSDDLMPDLFAGPYLYLEPQHAFVLADDARAAHPDRVLGYVLGTSDTARFAENYRKLWIPRLGAKYPLPPVPPVTPDDVMLAAHFRPERMLIPELAGYPAHLHIDLLPEAQRRGHGRALIHAFLQVLAAEHVAAVHLGMRTDNASARAFYDRLGFAEIPVSGIDGVTFLARSTTP